MQETDKAFHEGNLDLSRLREFIELLLTEQLSSVNSD